MKKSITKCFLVCLILMPTSLKADPWRLSVGVVAASSVADVTSSWGYGEGNPLLRNGRGEFGAKGLIIKGVIIGGYLGAQHLILRKRPQWRRGFTKGNWVVAGWHGGIAVSNLVRRRRQ